MNVTQFSLRPWNSNDLCTLIKYANNPHIAKFMMDKFPHPYTEETGKNFITFATADIPIRMFAIDIKGEAVGGIGIHPQYDIQSKNAELGYWLAEPFWGKGIMTKAIPQILDFAFRTYDLQRVFARPFGTNLASQHVLEKCGFKLEARFNKTFYKNGEFIDELVYAFRKTE